MSQVKVGYSTLSMLNMPYFCYYDTQLNHDMHIKKIRLFHLDHFVHASFHLCSSCNFYSCLINKYVLIKQMKMQQTYM